MIVEPTFITPNGLNPKICLNLRISLYAEDESNDAANDPVDGVLWRSNGETYKIYEPPVDSGRHSGSIRPYPTEGLNFMVVIYEVNSARGGVVDNACVYDSKGNVALELQCPNPERMLL